MCCLVKQKAAIAERARKHARILINQSDPKMATAAELLVNLANDMNSLYDTMVQISERSSRGSLGHVLADQILRTIPKATD